MHTITLAEPVTDSRWALPDGEYLAEDISAAELCIAAPRGSTKLAHFTPQSGGDDNTASTLLVSNGGFGDMLALTPALRRFQELWPKRPLWLSTRKSVHCVFDHLPFAPGLLNYPPATAVVKAFNRVLTTEHLQESSEEGRTTPAIDIKARVLGVGPLVGDQRKTAYTMSDAERERAKLAYPRRSMKRIGIQLAASSPTRSYHPKRAGEVMERLYNAGHEIYILGTPGSMPMSAVPEKVRDRIINITDKLLVFRESVAVAATCDCLFVPDSSFLHVAGALNIPAVAIWGSTKWQLRSADYPSVLSIQSNVGCRAAPCHFHPSGHHLWVAGEVCSTAGHCVPLNSITPETICAKIEKQLAR